MASEARLPTADGGTLIIHVYVFVPDVGYLIAQWADDTTPPLSEAVWTALTAAPGTCPGREGGV
jgi:hypothetical protein